MPSPKKQGAPLGATLVVMSSFFYASYGIWTVLLGNALTGFTASAVRSAMVLVMLVPLALLLRQVKPINVKRDWLPLLGLVVTSFLIWGPFYYAILTAGVGMSLAVNYAGIVIGMFFFGWLLAGEKMTRDKWLSAALGLLGLWLVFAPNMEGVGWMALGAAAVSGLSSAAHSVVGKKLKYSAIQTIILGWSASVIANVIMWIVLADSFPADLGIGWWYLVLFAVASVASTWMFMAGLKRIDAGAAGVLGLLEIVFGVVIGALLFNERPSLLALGGVIIILIAAAIPYLKDFNIRRGTLGK